MAAKQRGFRAVSEHPAIFIDEFDAGRFKRTGYHINCRALIHGFSACIPPLWSTGAFLDALSHQLLFACLRRFRRAVFGREPKPDAGRGTVYKLNTGRF